MLVLPPNPVPTIASISPQPISVGAPNTDITITGTGFVPDSVVWWYNVALPTDYVSPTSLAATVPSTYLSKPIGTWIVVISPPPGGGASNAFPVTVGPNPIPRISAISVNKIISGSPDTGLNVSGTNFRRNSVVRWNNVAIPTAMGSPTLLYATIPAAYLVKPVNTQITVFTPAPGGGASSGVPISVYAQPPVPTASSVSPNAIPAGSPNTAITVTGTGFQANSVVKWNNAALATAYISSTKLTATVPAPYLVKPVTTQITVTTPAPGGGTSSGVPISVTP